MTLFNAVVALETYEPVFGSRLKRPGTWRTKITDAALAGVEEVAVVAGADAVEDF